MDPIIINIFWTGGLDSTYRICELSLIKNLEIRPIYIKFRHNCKEELNAIKIMSEKIIANPLTKAKLLPVRIIDIDTITIDKEIEQAYQWIKEHNIVEFGLKRFPIQYMYLASFCKQEGIVCEIGIESEPHNRMQMAISKFGMLVESQYDCGGRFYLLDKVGSNRYLYSLLKYFHFPLPLYHISKQEEIIKYKEMGYDDIIGDTWFCHNPIKGKPCGYCSPCRQVMIAGMSYRLPKSALLRNRFSYIFLLWHDKLLPIIKRMNGKV